MASKNEEEYGVLAGTAKSELEKGAKDTVESVSQTGNMLSNLGGYLKRDIGNQLEWESLSPEQQIAVFEKEKKEKEAAEAAAKQKEDDDKKAAEAEKARLAELKKSYIVHTAIILCSCAAHESYVVLPVSHGEFIHGIPQLNIGDSKPDVNIKSFGICTSPGNPSVKEAAKKIIDDIKNRPKTTTEKAMDLFSKDPSDEIGKDLASQCAGKCDPQIFTDWIDGKEDVLIDGKPALLGRCTLHCGYGGEITLFTSGQME